MIKDEVIVSRHALDRLKMRVGIPRKAAKSLAQRAFDIGIHHSEAQGRLRRFMDKLFLQHGRANNTRIYGNHVYLFHKSTLITVIHLPHEMINAAKNSKCRA